MSRQENDKAGTGTTGLSSEMKDYLKISSELRNKVSSCGKEPNRNLYSCATLALDFPWRTLAEGLQLEVDDAHQLLGTKSKQMTALELQLQKAKRQAREQETHILSLQAKITSLRDGELERDSSQKPTKRSTSTTLRWMPPGNSTCQEERCKHLDYIGKESDKARPAEASSEPSLSESKAEASSSSVSVEE
eukprot:4346486-Pyramimonas_sp.AAC.2